MNLGTTPLALASLGLGSLSLYFYLKSITYDLNTDISELFMFIRAKRDLDAKQSGDWRGIADTWEETVQRHRNKTSLIYVNDNVSYTFLEVNERANQGEERPQLTHLNTKLPTLKKRKEQTTTI
jgi:hypothetical protein